MILKKNKIYQTNGVSSKKFKKQKFEEGVCREKLLKFKDRGKIV